MHGKLPEHDLCHMKRAYSVARGNVGLCHCWAADACKRDAMARWLVRVGTAGATCACEMASARGEISVKGNVDLATCCAEWLLRSGVRCEPDDVGQIRTSH